MASAAYDNELHHHSTALLEALQAAGVPYVQLEDSAAQAVVMLRPTLRAWRIPPRLCRTIDQTILASPEPWFLVQVEDTSHGPRRVLWAYLGALATYCVQWGRHPSCLDFYVWHIHVISALMQHGWYDPTTGHTPPPSQQLDALERVEEGRDMLNAIVPGFGDVQSGHRPSTPEGRAMIWHRVTDDEGNEHFVRDADLPDDDDTENDNEEED